MRFHFGFGKKKKMWKLMGDYVKARMKERRAFEVELEELDVWFRGKIIDQRTYQRMKDGLEVGFARQREEALACLQNSILNTLPLQDSTMFGV